MQLPELLDGDFDRIENDFDPPRNFSFNNRKHKTTAEFMRVSRIYALWKPKPEESAVFELIGTPQMKETVQILLMGRLPPDQIVGRLEHKYGKALHPRTIDTFRHYFWNVDLASADSWMTLLAKNPMRDHYLAALWGSREQALYRAGFSPKMDGKRALREAHRALALRIEATRLFPDSKTTSQMLTTMSKELVAVHHALYGEGAGIEEALQEMRKFHLQRKDSNVIPLREIAPRGNYSGGEGS